MTTTQPRALLVGLTLVNVCMQLGSAFLLKITPEPERGALLLVGLILCVVLALNVARFVVWGAIHKRYPLSKAYPLSAIFFPCVVVLAWLTGEEVGFPQMLGAGLVMAGVVWMIAPHSSPDDESTVSESLP